MLHILEDILLFGNSFMLKKYNVTVQRSLIYNINQKTNRLCNTSIVNRMFNRTNLKRLLFFRHLRFLPSHFFYLETTISPSSENTPVTSVTINPDDVSINKLNSKLFLVKLKCTLQIRLGKNQYKL